VVWVDSEFFKTTHNFFGGGRGSNPKCYIYYALSLSTELISRGQTTYNLKKHVSNFYYLTAMINK